MNKTKNKDNILFFVLFIVITGSIIFAFFRLGELLNKKELGEAYRFDYRKYLTIPEEFIVYREFKRIDIPEYGRTSCIAVNSKGEIFLGIDNKVMIFDGAFLYKMIELEKYVNGIFISEGVNSGIFVSYGNSVSMFSFNGLKKYTWKLPSDKSIASGICANADYLFIGDAGEKVLWKYDFQGNFVKKREGFILYSIANLDIVMDTNSILVAHSGIRKIEEYDYDLNLIRSWGKSSRSLDGFSGCCNPTHIALLGKEYLITTEKNIVRVKIYTKDGILKGTVASPLDFDQNIFSLDVASDKNGIIYILDPVMRKVRIFKPKE